MIDELSLTVLVENTAGGRGLLGEHGVAFHLEADGQRILFDTGQGMALAHNAERLGVDLRALDAVVLSHGHYDHTGGLPGLLELGARPALYLHPDALGPKYNAGLQDIGAPLTERAVLQAKSERMVPCIEPTEVVPGVWATGEIPRCTPFEDTGRTFYRDNEGTLTDTLLDDQALVVETHGGLVVLLGCGHSGVINTLKHVHRVSGGVPLRALFGGLHLLNADMERIQATADALARYDIGLLGPNHCTGQRALSVLWSRFPDRVVECKAGSRFHFSAAAP
jgi:7,8-dihydropterin-6-yl-methyl-4-(beta-D-ribofuranosyl)aminobenzene 5'-phosphate synthase